jgi:holo-[acyl-carrier protein] synthase
MHCIGVDIVEIARLEESVARWGEDFLNRVYTDTEIKLYRQKLPSLAVRFAAKEAVIKALGQQGKKASLKDIEVLSGPGGQPVVNLYGRAQQQAKAMGLVELAVSLSHSKEYAVAFVSGDSKLT